MADAPLKICLASSEFTPLAKTGGLADVTAALSSYLHAQGHDIRVMLPFYQSIDTSGLDIHPVEYMQNLEMRVGPHNIQWSVDAAKLPGKTLEIYLLRCPALYDRSGIYAPGPDEHIRFLFLTRAAIEMCQHMGFAPDIFHCHDWHTAMAPLYLRTMYSWDKLFANTKTVLTIHNIGYQGVFNADTLPDTGLEEVARLFYQEDLALGRISFLKTGVLYADLLTTVSPTYAKEILAPEYGMGLEELLHHRQDSTVGILNGVDHGEWDPETDTLIPHNYSVRKLAGKKKNKRSLMWELDLDYSTDMPLVGMVTRLTYQKGIELVQKVVPGLLQERTFAMAILGNGEPRYEQFFTWLQNNFRDRVCYYRGFSNKLAHWIEAGSDIFLMPSRFEPCGLNQMYSLRYGTVPVVRNTGGLADSVQNYNPDTGEGNGIVFNDFN
ncbi:MAG: glycogen synthase, partial [Xanthomonadales bacterium]|nr:glycogen synthase [Xanthomonadales bacterium]